MCSSFESASDAAPASGGADWREFLKAPLDPSASLNSNAPTNVQLGVLNGRRTLVECSSTSTFSSRPVSVLVLVLEQVVRERERERTATGTRNGIEWNKVK